MDYPTPIPWLQIVGLAWLIGLTVTAWIRRPGVEAGKAVEALRADFAKQLDALRGDLTGSHSGFRQQADRSMTSLDARVAAVEKALVSLPTAASHEQLVGMVKVVQTQMQGHRDMTDTVRASVNRIEDLLLQVRSGNTRM